MELVSECIFSDEFMAAITPRLPALCRFKRRHLCVVCAPNVHSIRAQNNFMNFGHWLNVF